MFADYSFVEISTSALLHNWQLFRDLLPSQIKIAAVIKSNAYGHGQQAVMSVLEDKADYWQVDSLRELELVRKRSAKPTLFFGFVPKKSLPKAVELQPIFAAYDLQQLQFLNKIGQEKNTRILVHIKIDAQFGRQGLLIDQLPAFLKEVKRLTNIEVAGHYAHYAETDNSAALTHTKQQLSIFKKVQEIFLQAGYEKITPHISATAGILSQEVNSPEHSLVRLGIGLYGMWPSAEMQKKWEKKLPLKPVLRWVSMVAQIKTLPSNYPIGYGATFITSSETKIAVVPVGYSDGFDRGLSNCGDVLVRGQRCQVLGRVSMNMIVVDVTKLAEVKIEDEVVIIGKQGDVEVTADEIAKKINTINYEVVTRISPFLTRKVVV